MKPTHYLFLVALLAGSSFFPSCRGVKTTGKDTLTAMPDNYQGTHDSSSAALLPYRQYFSDPGLVALIDEGISNNLDAAMALKRVEAAQAGVRMAKGAMLPTVSANAAFWQRKFGLYTMDGAGNITTDMLPGQIVPIHLSDYYTGLLTAWEVDLWGKLRNRKKAALSRYLSGVEGRNLVITTVVAEIAAAYYDLLALDNQLDVIRETIVIQEKAVELAAFQKEKAAANELAVKQFRAQLLNSQALEHETLQLITETESTINVLLGRYPQPVARNKAEFKKPLAISPTVGVPADLMSNRPDIRQAELELMASKADLKAARAAFYPSLNITGSYGFQAFRTDLLFQSPQSIAYSLLGNLVAPLVNRSALKAEFRSANAAQQEALCKYQKTIINGYVEVYNEVARISNLQKIAGLKAQEAEVFSQTVETAGELFRKSRANYIEVLMTQKNALDSQLQLLETKKRQYRAVIGIYKALGGGWK